MKKIATAFLMGVIIATATSCTDYPPLNPPPGQGNGGGHGNEKVPTVSTGGSIPAVRTSLTFKGTISNTGGSMIVGRFFIVHWTDPMTGIEEEDTIQVSGGGMTFSYTKTDCLPGLRYYYKAGAVNTVGIGYGPEQSLKNAGTHKGQDFGYGIAVYTYANYDSAIVAKKYDLNGSAGFFYGTSGVPINGTSSALLAGRNNTDTIIAQEPDYSAAQMCKNYLVDGVRWYLPSSEELQKTKECKNVPAFQGSFLGGYFSMSPSGHPVFIYWSSTQSDASNAEALDWDGTALGPMVASPKEYYYGIRPITYAAAP
ncbi:hypothetical protein IT401_02490 [Candidatus Nomurabacteria bacterium]|nr:hypothetical protein [Candidatus Nomurabacteria bacterium]